MATLDPTDLADLYWAGRTTMVTRRDQIPVYDRVFRRFFLDERESLPEPWKSTMKPAGDAERGARDPGDRARHRAGATSEPARLGLVASDVEVFRHKSFAACTPEELAALRRIMAQIRLMPPRRRTRRTVAARAGRRPDPRRTVRETMRMHGEPAELFWRRRRLRDATADPHPRRVGLDVRLLAQPAAVRLLARRAASRVEVFCFGTRLTRITKALERRRPDDALDQAARAVFDWEGGTRIGDSLDAFVREWGRRGMSRGAIVVICSDGLDRGDPAVLAGAMERLSRLSHRIVWMNPHKGNDADFRPSTLGMMVAAPHIDLLLSGHDLAQPRGAGAHCLAREGPA